MCAEQTASERWGRKKTRGKDEKKTQCRVLHTHDTSHSPPPRLRCPSGCISRQSDDGAQLLKSKRTDLRDAVPRIGPKGLTYREVERLQRPVSPEKCLP